MIKPGRSTISRTLKKLRFCPGLNRILMEAMKRRIEALPEQDREVVVVFDEMALRVRFTYDATEDKIIGFVDFGNGVRLALLEAHRG